MLAGEPVVFNADLPSSERVVPAEWIVEAVRNSISVSVTNAYISGDLDLTGTTVESQLTLFRCDILGEADFSETTFKRDLLLGGTTFHSTALFNDAIFERGIFLQSVHFLGLAQFHAVQFTGPAVFQSVLFGDEALFTRARFDDQASFAGATLESDSKFVETQMKQGAFFLPNATLPNQPSVEFKGVADFTNSEIQVAYFGFAHFDKAAVFRNVRIARDADFQPTAFDGGADFSGAEIGGTVTFGRIYNSASHGAVGASVNFDGTRVGGNAFFEGITFTNETGLFNLENMRIGGVLSLAGSRFNGNVSLSGIDIGGQAQFSGAVFNGDFNFETAHVGSRVLFGRWPVPKEDPAIFKGLASFGGARFGGDVSFVDVQFLKKTDFNSADMVGPVNFKGARFDDGLNFRDADIKKAISFDGARFSSVGKDSEATFLLARFGSDISFANASFQSVADFVGAQVDGPADFVGTIFERAAIFAGVVVKGSMIFRNSKFADDGAGADLNDVQILENADFRSVAFNGQLHFARAHVGGQTGFQSSVFRGAVNFEGSDFGGRLFLATLNSWVSRSRSLAERNFFAEFIFRTLFLKPLWILATLKPTQTRSFRT